MGVVATPTAYPEAGVPSEAVIQKTRKGMAGCGSCLGSGGAGLGGGEDWAWLGDVGKSVSSLVTAMWAPPTYRSTSASGTTEIRGSTMAPLLAGTTTTLSSGMSTTTMVMLGLGAMMLMMMMNRR